MSSAGPDLTRISHPVLTSQTPAGGSGPFCQTDVYPPYLRRSKRSSWTAHSFHSRVPTRYSPLSAGSVLTAVTFLMRPGGSAGFSRTGLTRFDSKELKHLESKEEVPKLWRGGPLWDLVWYCAAAAFNEMSLLFFRTQTSCEFQLIWTLKFWKRSLKMKPLKIHLGSGSEMVHRIIFYKNKKTLFH